METTTVPHVTARCMFCQQTSTVELSRLEAELWKQGTPIQDAMPDRPADERELIRSGIHPQCWTEAFGTTD